MKKGFTLSEVLITLGIIGVVAALTLPTLLSKIQERVLKEQYKKTFSTINQSLQQVYNNTDMYFNCYYGTKWKGATCKKRDEKGYCIEYNNDGHNDGGVSECRLLENELKKVLKISQICEKNAFKKGCIAEYKGLDNIYSNKYENSHGKPPTDYEINAGVSGCEGYRQKNILNNNFAWVLQDGTIIGGYDKSFWKIFYIDINGKAKPNKWGYDIFSMMIVGDGTKLFIKQAGCGMIEKGGHTGKEMLSNSK